MVNDGTTLYVTGLSTRVSERELEDHFSKEGKVCVYQSCQALLVNFFLISIVFSGGETSVIYIFQAENV